MQAAAHSSFGPEYYSFGYNNIWTSIFLGHGTTGGHRGTTVLISIIEANQDPMFVQKLVDSSYISDK